MLLTFPYRGLHTIEALVRKYIYIYIPQTARCFDRPTDLRRDEKLRETVQRPPEVVRPHVEKVHRVFGVGVGVAGASVRA